MKPVFDNEGHIVVKETSDGKKLPVYEYEDGTKEAFDAGATVSGLNKKINALEDEKTRHATKAESLSTQLEAFKDLDPDQARDAIVKVKNLSDKKILDEKGVEAIKSEVRNDMKVLHEEAIELLKTNHGNERKNWDETFVSQEKMIEDLVIDNLFSNSSYFSGKDRKTIYPASDAKHIFGRHFSLKKEDGKIVTGIDGKPVIEAKDSQNKPIISKINHGEPAEFEEAIGLIIDKHPRKTEIMKGGDGEGPDSGGNLTKDGKKFSEMSSVEKIAAGLKRHKQSSQR